MVHRFAIVTAVVVVCGLHPPEISAQGRPGLPEVDRAARNRVAFRLYVYYHFQNAGRGASRYMGPLCDADRGDICYDLGDWESTCRLYRCSSEKDRTGFVRKLAELAREYPHSPEAMGHAVYAALRLDRMSEVEGLLDLCDPQDAWWCDLLRGYALHRTRRSAEAESLVRRGVASAPPEIRCRLEDVSQLLPDAVREQYEDIPCDDRDDVHRILWWLADPFHMDPGNDRWVEHVTRVFAIYLHESRLHASRSPWLVHTDVHDRDMIRRGYRDSWGAGTPWDRPIGTGWTSIRGAANHFVPDAMSLDGLTETTAWRIEGGIRDEGYTRPGGRTAQAPGQIARFLQNDSLVVALASDLGSVRFEEPEGLDTDADSTGTSGEVEGGARPDTAVGAPLGQVFFVTSEGPDQVAHLDPVPIRDRVTFAASLPNRPQVVGMEVFSPVRTARRRAAALPIPIDRPALSDLLVFRPLGSDLPETRIRAIALMLGDLAVSRDDRIGLYWEAYGVDPQAPLEVAVTLVGEEGGLLSRLGGLIGLGREETRATVNWTEPPRDTGVFRRAITLDIRGLEPGAHEVRVEVTLPDGSVLARSLTLEVRGGEG